MIKLLSTLPAQVLEPLCGLASFPPGRPMSSRAVALLALALAVAVAGWLHWRTPTEQPTARHLVRLRRREGAAGGAARQGMGSADRLLPLPVRRTLERRRQRRVRPQRLQHPRRHPASRPHRPRSAARHLLCPKRCPDRPVHRLSRSPSSAAPRPPRRCRSTTWFRCRMPGTRVPASGTTSAAAISPTIRATCWPSAQKPTSTRLFAMPTRGCRRTRRSAASSSHGRLR